MKIDIIYALPNNPLVLTCEIGPRTTVQQALHASGILSWPNFDLTEHTIGIYGKFVTLDTILREEDRIEIYCPLRIDPKTVRMKRAKEQK